MRKGLLTVISFGLGAISSVAVSKVKSKQINSKDKYWYYYETLIRWLELKNNGHSLEEFFINNQYNNIAIYGMGHVGMRLYEELKNSSINVKYGIDAGVGLIIEETELDIFAPDEELEPVDIIVVTSLFAYDKIQENFAKKKNVKIISLEEVVNKIKI